MAKEGWLAFPEDRSFVTFPGNLLHGVLPGNPGSNSMSSSSENASNTEAEHRLTLLVAWWNKETQSKAPRTIYGPQSSIPKISSKTTWPRLIDLDKLFDIQLPLNINATTS